MKKKTWITGAITGLLIATGCQAGWLHQAYQGEFCAHNHKYVVTNTGAILIETKQVSSMIYYGSEVNRDKTWVADISFSDLSELDNVISDLQKVSKEMHQKQSDSGCKPGCGD